MAAVAAQVTSDDHRQYEAYDRAPPNARLSCWAKRNVALCKPGNDDWQGNQHNRTHPHQRIHRTVKRGRVVEMTVLRLRRLKNQICHFSNEHRCQYPTHTCNDTQLRVFWGHQGDNNGERRKMNEK